MREKTNFGFLFLMLLCVATFPNHYAAAQEEAKQEQSSSGKDQTQVQPPKKLTDPKQSEQEKEQKKGLSEPLKPLLWKITHKDYPKVHSYLFGSTHSKAPSVLKFHPAVQGAIDRSHILYMELTPDQNNLRNKTLVMGDYQKLEHRISKETISQLEDALKKINPKYDRTKLPRYRVWAWALILPSFYRQEKAGEVKDQDTKLLEIAIKSRKNLISLEKAREQLVPMNYLSKKEQENLLLSSFKTFNDEKKQARYIQLYLEGDTDKLKDYHLKEYQPNDILDKDAQFKIKNFLITVRNRKMKKKMLSVLTVQSEKIHFFSAGTPHMVGEGSIPELLRKDGFTVTRILRDDDATSHPDAPPMPKVMDKKEK